MSRQHSMRETALLCVRAAEARGASQVAVVAQRQRDVTVQWRDGRVEKVNEATTRRINLRLYVDGRYSSVSTSDLRLDALEEFVSDSVTMTRSLAEDPCRSLPDPRLYEGRSEIELELEDPRHADVTPEQRREMARELEGAARSVDGHEAILSVTTGVSDTRTEFLQVHSDGFEGFEVGTQFWVWAEVSAQDGDGRRPEDWSAAGARFFSDLPGVGVVGREAAERALGRRGSKKGASAVLTMAIDPRAGGRLVGALGGALSGRSLQQKRSFLEGQLGRKVGSDLLHITDDPLVPKGFGSRAFDGEGIAGRRLPVFERGVLRNYYIDTYYGKKLELEPTTGSRSNLAWRLGEQDQAALLREIGEGILVSGFLGGNSNSTTGDYSFGISGFRVRSGQLAEPVAEMNIAGNQADLLQRLSAVGNDPYAYSASRTPTLVFDGIQFAGS